MGIDRRRRASLALTLNLAALLLAVSALTTSHWCEGTRKVVKPLCTGPVSAKPAFCILFNSSAVNDSRLVHYIWETGEDKYVMRKFHTGIWFSCEQNLNMSGELCRNFLYVAPANERGVLWLCIVAECLYILLLATGGILMSLEVCHIGNVINGLKLNAFAAIFTVLSGEVCSRCRWCWFKEFKGCFCFRPMLAKRLSTAPKVRNVRLWGNGERWSGNEQLEGRGGGGEDDGTGGDDGTGKDDGTGNDDGTGSVALVNRWR
ncbi:germ cell-specific gene 1-like protein [Thalassophryne amazonica]|uniref:germ cell-specific gene 1-like protein n=1 Tax=Thalassophryne amazonica TaxID=390379 RepID=UPI0014714CA1|nr:germ cell-specific gene 1-like protein [Thalassophryne amazonica]